MLKALEKENRMLPTNLNSPKTAETESITEGRRQGILPTLAGKKKRKEKRTVVYGTLLIVLHLGL